jgi:hypothetical protein
MFHTFVVLYTNSSVLERFVGTDAVGTIYTLSAALTILIFLFISHVLRRVGNFKLTVGLLLLNLLAVSGLAFADSLRTVVPLFLIHLTVIPLIVFNLDVYLEETIGNNEGVTGSRRGLLLTLTSFVGALAPLTGSLMIDSQTGSFATAYLVSAATLIPIIILLLFFFPTFTNPPYHEIRVFAALRSFWARQSIRAVFLAHFILQMFFTVMVVYTPLYLVERIGLTWAEFGIVMFFAQMAYVIFEYPIGVIADRFIGEKEMMGLGFLILAISVAWMSFVTLPNVVIWSIIMFVTRVGASFVEVTTESNFFKQTKSSDAQIISFFRITRPLAMIVGALGASLVLLYLPFNYIYIVTALLMVPALFFTLNINDSK